MVSTQGSCSDKTTSSTRLEGESDFPRTLRRIFSFQVGLVSFCNKFGLIETRPLDMIPILLKRTSISTSNCGLPFQYRETDPNPKELSSPVGLTVRLLFSL